MLWSMHMHWYWYTCMTLCTKLKIMISYLIWLIGESINNQNMWHHLSKQLTVSRSYSLSQQYTFAIHKYNTDMCVVQN